MSLTVKDRVKQFSSTAGSGILTLNSVPVGYVGFSEVFSSGDQTYYCIENKGEFEIGIGTYGVGGANTLSRDTVLNSSTGASLALSGRSTIFVTVPAQKMLYTGSGTDASFGLADLNNVTLSAPSSGQILSFTGSEWVNGPVPGSYSNEEAQDAVGNILTDSSSISFAYSDGTPSIVASVRNSGVTNDMLATGIDTSKIGDGSVSLTEFGYLDGVTSSIQTQFGNKANTSVQVIAGTGLSGGGNLSADRTINLANTTVTPGSYTLSSFTVDAQGRITAAASGSFTKAQLDTAVSDGNVMYSGDAPTSHSHGNITNAGAIGSTSGLPIITTTGGALTTGAFGTTSGTFAEGNDSRITGALSAVTAASTYLPLAGGTLVGSLTLPAIAYNSLSLTIGSGFGFAINGGVQLWTHSGGNYLCASTDSQLSYRGGVHITFSSNSSFPLNSDDVGLVRHTTGTIRVSNASTGYGSLIAGSIVTQNGTTPTEFNLHNTFTSTTAFETFRVKANAGAAYQIGSAVGSAGGTNRDLSFGQWNAAGTFSNLLNISGASGGSTVRIATTSSAGTCGLEFGSTLSGWQMGQATFAYNGLGGWGTTFSLVVNRGGGPLNIVTPLTIDAGGNTVFTQMSSGGGSPTAFTITGAAHTSLTASTEATDINFNLARTVQFANGNITIQRAFRIQAPVYSHVSGSNTIATASTVAISGPPTTTGGFTTITNVYALHVESGRSFFGGPITVGGGLVIGPFTGFGVSTDYIQASSSWSVEPYFIGYPWHFAFDGNTPKITMQTANATTGVRISSDSHFAFTNSSNSRTGAVDLSLNRDAANVLAQRNSTTAQAFRAYNTYTSSTSGEWGEFNWQTTSNVLRIGTNKGSAGGSARDVAIVHGGTVVANFLSDRFYLGPITDGTTTGGNARGANAIDLQIARGSAGQVASGLYAVILGGQANTASGNRSIVVAAFSGASTGDYATIVGGSDQVASGRAAFIGAGESNQATASYATISGGFYGVANRYGQRAHASGAFVVAGDAQSVGFVLRNKTTNNTPTNLMLDGSSARLTIPSGKTMTGFLIVKGIKSDGSAKARFVRLIDITNVGGTTTLDTAIEAIGTDYNPSGCSLAVTAENATDDLQVNITAPSGETWRWVATLNGLEIAYGV